MPVTTSTASIIQNKDETFGWDNLAPTAGTWRNLFYTPTGGPLTWGRLIGKFTFEFERVIFKFSNMSPTIPSDAKIVSAILRGTATADSTTATFFTVIFVHAKDGLWNPASAGPLWRSASPVGTPSEMDVVLLNTGAGTLVDTAVTPTHPWAIRDNGLGLYLKAGQAVQVVTAGTLGFADISIDRTGAVAVGNIWCEIYSRNIFGLADTLLATSNTRPASAAPGAGFAPFRFTFSGAEQISLSALQWVVVVLNGDYPVSATQNIAVGWTTTGGAHGAMQLFGTGVGYDDQNYPMQDSFRTIANGTTGFGVWVAPRFFTGIEYDTPSFGALLQQIITNPGYVAGDPFSVSLAKSNFLFPPGTADRRWAEFGNATYTTPTRLIVQWKKRYSQVV